MKKLNRAIFTIGSFTMLSRVVGLIRDLLIARFLGTTIVADAFFVALKSPNLFRRFSAEGALSASFVPVFSQLLTKDKEKAMEFANKTLAIMVSILVPFCVLMMIIMPWFVYLIAPGFYNDPEKFALTVELARITFPFLLFISIVALFGGMLNAVGKYAPFAGAPIIFNLSLIAALLLPRAFGDVSYSMALAIPISGVLQLILMLSFLHRAKLKIRPVKPKLDRNERKFLKLMGHGVLGSGIMQINVFVGTLLASLLPTGAISYLYYADRLNQLPVGVVGVAIGTAMLPMLSKAVANKDKKKATELLNKSIVLGLFYSIACGVALFVVAEPIIDLVFNHGKFTDSDVLACSMVLRAYLFGLPAYILSKILANVFFAKHNTRTPMITSSISAVCNIVLAVALLKPFGYVGIASATAIAAWVNVYLLYKKQNIEILPETKTKAFNLIVIGLTMGAILSFGNELLAYYIASPIIWVKMLYIAILLGVGGLSMLTLCHINEIIDLSWIGKKKS